MNGVERTKEQKINLLVINTETNTYSKLRIFKIKIKLSFIAVSYWLCGKKQIREIIEILKPFYLHRSRYTFSDLSIRLSV